MADDDVASRASTLLDLDRPEEALELLAPVAATGHHAGVHQLFVVALSQLGRVEEAAAAARHALTAVGPVPELTRVASYVFRAVGEPGLALEVARAGVQAAPAWVPGLLGLVFAELAVGNRRGAEAAVAQALALAPDDPATHLAAADLALALNRRRVAREACRAALRLDPTSISALRGLGLIDERGSRYGSAARWYARALLLAPGDTELTTRVRGLFGRMLGTVVAVLMLVDFVVFVAFMSQADPAPGQRAAGGLPEPVFWGLMALFYGGLGAYLVRLSLRGTPRVVLDALRSEVRVYRRVRRCWRLALTLGVVTTAVTVAAVIPLGDPPDRLMPVFLLWFLAMTLAVVALVVLVRTFGRGGLRPATPGRRDQSLAA